jgi:GDPmannose 4,6-dehydratase
VHPLETLESVVTATQNILDGIRLFNPKIKFFNACSTECFGHTGDRIVDETSEFQPQSPYAEAKSAAFLQVASYRDAYGMFVCSGILSNHESPLRSERFVTQKIVSSACRISLGSNEHLELSNVNVVKDWGWAPEYVEVMWRMLQHCDADDYIIGTGKSTSLLNFVDKVFSELNLNYLDYLSLDSHVDHPKGSDITRITAIKAQNALGWKAKIDIDELVAKLVTNKLNTDVSM